MKNFKVLIFLILWAVFLCACSKHQEKTYKESRESLHTIVSITVVSDSSDKAKSAIDKAYNELDRLAKLLNFYAEDSEVSAINRHAGDRPVKVSAETFEIIEKALYASRNTEGAFDITVGPVVKLWDFKNKVMPNTEQIREKTKIIGYRHIVIDRPASTVFLEKKGMQIDLGGIIKGYAADKAVAVLKANGIKSGIVAAAGDIKTFGKRQDGSLWSVGIKNPRQKSGADEIIAVVNLSNQAISTSGDYERYFEKNGVRYHHILDPQTGQPAYGCRSVTIVAKDAAVTDAFSTGIFVLGPKKGIDVLNRLGIDAVIIDKDGKVYITDGLKNSIELMIKDSPFA
ncbi:MAG: FAD:protein FMN transferase [Nitrospirae bacterium]|nr:MAG: FAD:protein FMN transferase [Nitrospirota bacterium]